MNFECPHCRQAYEGDEKLLNQVMNCTKCGQAFYARPPQPVPAAPPATSPAVARQRKSLRRTAEIFSGLAKALFLIGLVPLLICLSGLFSESSGLPWFSTFGTLAGGCLFYLISQVIHIRANTHVED